MRTKFYFILLILACFILNAQALQTGNYTSSDGNYTVSIEQNGDEISLIEPNKSNIYKKTTSDYYYHTEPKYNTYYVRLVGNNKFYSGKNDGKEFLFTLSSTNPSEAIESVDNCPLYDKYLKLSQEDPVEVQAWTFCGAAAIAKCTYNAEASQSYNKTIIAGLKAILEDQNRCPCEDVISKSEWDAVPNY